VAILGAVVALSFVERRYAAPVAFGAIEEASIAVQNAGLCITADNPSGNITKGFLVSREPLHWLEIVPMSNGTYFAAEWKGKAWLARRWADWRIPDSIPEGAGVRVWGDIVAYGDPDFLDVLERALKDRRP
jgi:hypothetical protein